MRWEGEGTEFLKDKARESVEEELTGWALWVMKSHPRIFISSGACECVGDSKPQSSAMSPLRLCTVNRALLCLSSRQQFKS